MERVIATLDEMVRNGVIEDYVIGGATALAYYSDNIFTEDVDVFVYLKSSSVYLIDLNPIYEYLTKIQLGKSKYRERIRKLIEEKTYDVEKLNRILQRHALMDEWHSLEQHLRS